MYVLLPDNRSSQPPAPMVYGRIAPMSEKRNSKSAYLLCQKHYVYVLMCHPWHIKLELPSMAAQH